MFLGILIAFCLLLSTYQIAKATIALLIFTATPEISDIYLTWQTSSEVYNQGFYLQRSNQQNGTYTRINSIMIPSGSLGFGAQYDYVDQTVQVNTDYYYKLEAVDADGNSIYFGPIHAIILSSTAIPGSGTSTFTPTPTATSQYSPTPSRTPAPSFTPTVTPIGFIPPTATIKPSATQTSVQPITTSTPVITQTVPADTATLMPVPSVSFLFPVDTATSVALQAQTLSSTLDTSVQPTAVILQPAVNNKAIVLGVIVVLIWILLAGFIVIMVRRARS